MHTLPFLSACVCVLSHTLGVLSAPTHDQITSIPGWKGPLPSRQWSGYLDIEGGKHLHYVFVESENDPKNDPVVLWLNGGPGCSSLDGYIYENGPFGVDDKDHTQLYLRPYRWSRVASTLFLEAPVGVGFSWADDVSTYSLNTDDSTADDNVLALEKFYQLFPEFADRDLYITGESYAGVYIPTLAEAIHKASVVGTWKGAPLKGIAVGNGCTGTEVGICGFGSQGDAYLTQYLLQTAFVSIDLKAKIVEACDFESAIDELAPLSEPCRKHIDQAHQQIGHINLYNVYSDCTSSYPVDVMKAPHKSTYHSTLGGPDACINSFAATDFFSNASVQEAYHVKPPNGAGENWAFGVCTKIDGWSYKSTRPNLPRDTYPTLVRAYRVLIFNGDWDACVPYTDNESWTRRMRFPVKKNKEWHAWSYTSESGAKNQVAGYAVEYDVSQGNEGGGRFIFATVRGGRHEVPESAPAQAFEMLRRFLKDEDF